MARAPRFAVRGGSLRGRLLGLTGIAIVGVAVAAALLLSTWRSERSALRDQRDLVAASAAQADLLSDRASFLAPGTQAEGRLPQLAATLQASSARQPPLVAEVSALLAAHQAWRDAVLEPDLSLARAGRIDVARARENGGQGKALFDVIRSRAAGLAGDLRARSTTAGNRVSTLSTRLSQLLLAVLIGLLVLVGTQVLGVLRLVDRPLRRLGHDVQRVADGELDLEVAGHGPQEVIALGRDVEEMRRRLRRELEQVLRGQEALAQQGPAVLALQAALRAGDVTVDRLTLAARRRPAEGLLSGDWLHTLALDDGRLALALGDVSGHGPGPAVFALRLKHLLGAALGAGMGPAAAIGWAARQLGETGEMFATIFVAVLDPATGRLRYASAGHLDGLLLRALPFGTQPTALPATEPLVSGLLGEAGWRETQQDCAPGDVRVLFTDGLTEARDAGGEEFGMGRIRRTLGSGAARRAAPAELVDDLLRQAAAFAGGRLQDDCTLAACRFD